MFSGIMILFIFRILGIFCIGIPTIFKAKDIFLNTKSIHLIFYGFRGLGCRMQCRQQHLLFKESRIPMC